MRAQTEAKRESGKSGQYHIWKEEDAEVRLLVLSSSLGRRVSYRGTDRADFARGGLATESDYPDIRKVWDEHDKLWGKDSRHANDPQANREEIEDIERLGWSPSTVIRNIDEARWLVDAFREFAQIDLEIIEITRGKSEPDIGGEFLGFDLSAGYDQSLLSGGLATDFVEAANPLVPQLQPSVPGDPYKRLLALSLSILVGKYFEPRLNANGLFDDYDEAVFCLRCKAAIPFVSPESYEPEDTAGESDFEVLGLYKVN